MEGHSGGMYSLWKVTVRSGVLSTVTLLRMKGYNVLAIVTLPSMEGYNEDNHPVHSNTLI